MLINKKEKSKMDFCFGVIIILLATTKESIQSCMYIKQYDSPYSPRYGLCQNEVLSSNFHEKIPPLPRGIQMQWLQINNTTSPEIAAGAFSTLTTLRDLRIDGAGVHDIQLGAFRGLKYLNRLSLKNNKINELKEHYFINMTGLSQLDLSFNNIASMAENCFANLRYLTRLILQNNALTELPSNIFLNLTNIVLIDLSFNKFKTVDNKLLINLKRLDTLFLNNNNLISFDSSTLSTNSAIKNIYINNNYLTKISNLSISNSLGLFNVSFNLITFLSFSKLTYIETIDFTGNVLNSVKNLSATELYLDRNFLGLNQFESDIFKNLPFVEFISLSDNQISELNVDLFKNNTLTRKLILSRNYLRNKDAAGFPTSLQVLNISYNDFDSQLNITNLIYLRSFDISFNNLTKITFNFLKGLQLLNILNLSHNKIENISLGCFRDLKNLKKLDLSNNRISDLQVGIFLGLTTLNSLDISHNKLTILNNGVFHNLRYLNILNLGFNNMTYSNVENVLGHLSMLTEIGLAGNGWSCNILTQILKEYKKIKITNAADFDVPNVDGVACKFGATDPANLINFETKCDATINSKLFTNNTLLILILMVLIIKTIVKYVPWISAKEKLKNKLIRNKSEQELQIVNEY